MPVKPLRLRAITGVVVMTTITCIFFAFNAMIYSQLSLNSEDLQLLFLASVFGLFASIGLYRVEAWGLIVMWSLSLGWVAFSLQHLMSPSRALRADALALLVAVICLMVISQDSIRKLFFDKNLRWWQRPKRHAIDLPISITVGSVTFNGKLLNVSSEGCLAGVELELRHGEQLDLNFETADLRFHSAVKVVRKSSRPRGFGMVFIDQGDSHARPFREIRKLLKHSNPSV